MGSRTAARRFFIRQDRIADIARPGSRPPGALRFRRDYQPGVKLPILTLPEVPLPGVTLRVMPLTEVPLPGVTLQVMPLSELPLREVPPPALPVPEVALKILIPFTPPIASHPPTVKSVHNLGFRPGTPASSSTPRKALCGRSSRCSAPYN